jgi:hypothetical protein
VALALAPGIGAYELGLYATVGSVAAVGGGLFGVIDGI